MTAIESNQSIGEITSELQSILDRQKSAFLADGPASLETRLKRLDKVIDLLVDNQQALCDALDADYGGRSPRMSRMSEIMGAVNNAKNAKKHVKKWMKPERRKAPFPMNVVGAKTHIRYQAKGVIGNMTPWNVPVGMVFSPMVDMLAAGNRVMVKPSEFNPKTAELIKELVARYFDADEVTVVTGGPDVGAAFSSLAFDHLLFTGATSIGRLVMRSAAENLTPVTLELGGKSPVIVGDSASIEETAFKLINGKGMNCGQICISPDYVFVPADKVEEFVQHCVTTSQTLYPDPSNNADYNAMINERHYERITAYLSEAQAKGARIVNTDSTGAQWSAENKKIPIQLIIDPSEELTISQEEIFGPVMLIKPYTNLDDCISYINARPRPLALYYFGKDKAEEEKVLGHTLSGGVCVNNVMMHFTCEDAPFGGVGDSGMGHYHGHEGFKTFSHSRTVFTDGWLDFIKLGGMLPPYSEKTDKVLDSQIKK